MRSEKEIQKVFPVGNLTNAYWKYKHRQRDDISDWQTHWLTPHSVTIPVLNATGGTIERTFIPPMPYFAQLVESTGPCGPVTYTSVNAHGSLKQVTNICYADALQDKDFPFGKIPDKLAVPVYVEQRAINKAYKDLHGACLDLAEVFADLDETLEGIYGVVWKLGAALVYFLEGKWIKAFQELGLTVQQLAWAVRHPNQLDVMFKFAIAPLIDDVNAVILAMQSGPFGVDYAGQKKRFLSGKGKYRSKRHKWKQTIEGAQVFYAPSQRWEGECFGIACYHSERKSWSQTRCVVRMDYYVQNNTLAFASLSGAINPLLIAWNRIPLSFIVNWFIDIGAWLIQFQPIWGCRFLGTSITRSVVQETTDEWFNLGDTHRSFTMPGQASYKHMVRETRPSRPFAYFPTWGSGVNKDKLVTLIEMYVRKFQRSRDAFGDFPAHDYRFHQDVNMDLSRIEKSRLFRDRLARYGNGPSTLILTDIEPVFRQAIPKG